MPDGLDLLEQALRLEVRDHALARLEPVEAAIALRHLVVEPRLAVQDADHLEAVAAADLEVVEVVARRDLDRARAVLGVGSSASAMTGRRRPTSGRIACLADQVLVARVVGMDRDRGVAEHGLGPRGRDRRVAAARALDRVADVPQVPLHLGRLDLEVGDRGLQPAVPVDQALVLVDQALAVEVDEHLADRVREALVQGEALARPVGRGAEAMQLLADAAAQLLLPGPDPLDEGLAADLAAAQALALELALDHHLGRDAGVVGAGLPEHRPAAHPPEADQRVLDRVVQRMAHVQAAGDVRRRHDDAVGLAAGVGRGPEIAASLPRGVVSGLDLGRSVGLVEHRRRVPQGLFMHKSGRERAGFGL